MRGPGTSIAVLAGAIALCAAAVGCANDDTAPDDAADAADATSTEVVAPAPPTDDDATATDATEPAAESTDAAPAGDAPDDPPATDATATAPDSSVADAAELNEYIAEAAAFDQVDADSQFPQGLRFAAGGAPGYSRYVFREHSEGVVPTLVEGPLEGAVRCQDEALPCSYLELKALHESGAEPPPELQMSAAEVAELVAQLDELQAFAEAHRDIDAACAAGFVSDRIQTPNMGTHLYRIDWIVDGFDPARPEILLYARADDQLPAGALGQCENGTWNGEPMQLVGTAFIIPPQVIGADHPDTFVGPLDNWHIHYNLCRGNSTGRDTFVPRSECLASGGDFSEALGWMLHAWVDTEHDNQLGVFSMWNPTIAPLLDGGTIRDQREVRGSDFPDGAEQSLIADFLYTGDLTIQPGQPLFFNNVDAVPHTVTAGTPDAPGETFDSGLLNPGSNYSVEFDEPGVYSLFCALHPDMVATITVEGG